MTTETTAPRGITTDLHRAACIGDLAMLAERLAAGDPVDPRDADGYTPFLLACKHAEPDIFHALLAAGADSEATNARNMGGLFLVATTGVVSLARVLVERGADVNRVAARGLTPLIAGMMSENPYMVRLLIAAGADVDYTDPDGNSVIKWARKLGTREVVELIRNPDRSAIVLATPSLVDLHRAASTGDVELIRQCLAAAIPVDALDADGWTPLMAATRQGKRAAIHALLEAGADPYRPSPSGMTPLLLAANNPVALLPFAAMGADLNHAGERRGFCPLIYAARQGFDDVVRYLVSAGTDLQRTDRDGLTALDHATINGHRRIARLLREAIGAASPA
jgi:hypothetical protein